MNCPVCNRTLAPTLSICFTCGAMVNDTVREELQTKIGTGPIQKRAAAPITSEPKKDVPATPNPRPVRTITTELNRQKTSPTLVEFQTKNAMLPDWRLQLQNAVRHHKVGPSEGGPVGGSYQAQLVTSGANALKTERIEEPVTEPEVEHTDQRVANALKRIDTSRKKFLPEPVETKTAKAPEPRNYPFNVVSRNAVPAVRIPESKASVNVPPKPRLVPTVTLKKTGYDTNKLPPIGNEMPVSSIDIPVAFVIEEPVRNETFRPQISRVEALQEPQPVVEQPAESEIEIEDSGEIDDLAPFATRFNSGLFDLIIGLFASLILLSPIAFAGGDWMSGAGMLALSGTLSIVMFIYLTLSLAIFGKTAGMKMFSLELLDVDLCEYPNFHQAAVSSAVYLLTLPLAGVGFLTMLLNDEKRAAHDLLSGTIVITEI